MPSKKKKYNARFPAGRIKKIMQTDEEVGKVAQAVPVIISRTLELFVESLLTKSMLITQSRNAKTLTPSHMKQCILSESRFDFLKDLVKNIPDASAQEDNENNAIFEANLHQLETQDASSHSPPAAASSTAQTPVIQYAPAALENHHHHHHHVPVPTPPPLLAASAAPINLVVPPNCDDVPPLIPLASHQTHEPDNLCIDEDYDN